MVFYKNLEGIFGFCVCISTFAMNKRTKIYDEKATTMRHMRSIQTLWH